jgi:hypothetical protein
VVLVHIECLRAITGVSPRLLVSSPDVQEHTDFAEGKLQKRLIAGSLNEQEVSNQWPHLVDAAGRFASWLPGTLLHSTLP